MNEPSNHFEWSIREPVEMDRSEDLAALKGVPMDYRGVVGRPYQPRPTTASEPFVVENQSRDASRECRGRSDVIGGGAQFLLGLVKN